MQKIVGWMIVWFLFTGCNENKPKIQLDGEALLEAKCSMCHNLDIPPQSYENEKAPSMMAVTFHLKDFIKSTNPSEHEGKIVAFIQDFVIYPTKEKSFCDKASLESYGLMPSQKGNVNEDELEAIARYMYKTYDNQKLLKIMAEKQKLAKMPLHERVIMQQRCTNCHEIDKDKVAPSFNRIAQRYSLADKEMLMQSIRQGSKEKWEGFILPMPPFAKMSDEDIEGMVQWILGLK